MNIFCSKEILFLKDRSILSRQKELRILLLLEVVFRKIYKEQLFCGFMETITIPKLEFEEMKVELETLRKSRLYQRLLEFEERVLEGKKFTREDLGF